MAKYHTILKISQKASYEVAYLMAKEKNTYHRRNTHQTCCYCNRSNMSGDNVNEETKGIPLSADNIRQRISEMGEDIKCQLNDRVKMEIQPRIHGRVWFSAVDCVR